MRSSRGVCWVGVMLVAIALGVTADQQRPGSTCGPQAQDEVRSLEGKLMTLRVIQEFDFSREQLEALLEGVEEASAITRRYQERYLNLLEEQEEAFEAFYQEDLQNCGFTQEVEKRAASLDHQSTMLRKEYFEAINVLEEKLEALFTEAQKRLLEELPNSRLGKGIMAFKGKKRPNGDEEPTRESELREELGDIHKTRYGSVGLIGQFLVSQPSAEVLALLLGVDPDTVDVVTEEDGPKLTQKHADGDGCAARVYELRTDINLLNLINGLNLSTHQLEHLLQQNRELDPVRQGSGPPQLSYDTEEGMAYQQALEGMFDRLLAGGQASEQDEKQLARMRQRAMRAAKQQLFAGRSDPRRYRKALERSASAVHEVLFETQHEVLVDYSPCLIPPKNLKNPVRVGQASDNSRFTKMLEHLRSLPEKRWQKDRERILEKVIGRLEQHDGALEQDERGEYLGRLGDVLDRARSLDDLDFELEKEALLEELSFLNRKDALEDELLELTGRQSAVLRNIRSFLLHPRICALLEVRHEQLVQGQVEGQVDLDGIDPAESCGEDGSCAIDED